MSDPSGPLDPGATRRVPVPPSPPSGPAGAPPPPPPGAPRAPDARTRLPLVVGSAAVVVLALIGVGTYLLVSSGGSGSSPTTTTTASTAAPSPSTTAASTDFSAVTGTWTAHGSTLVIDASGHGSVGLPDSTACPSCSEAQAPTNTIAFTLTSVSDGQAVGAVTAVSDPRDPVTQSGAPAALGASVTIFPTTTAGQLQLEIAGSPVDQYCNPTAGATGACGA